MHTENNCPYLGSVSERWVLPNSLEPSLRSSPSRMLGLGTNRKPAGISHLKKTGMALEGLDVSSQPLPGSRAPGKR